MTLSNQEVINILNVFDDIASKDLPVSLAFDLYTVHSKLMEVYSSYIKALDRRMKKEGVENPGELSEESGINELLAREVEIDAPPIKKSTLIESECKFSLSQIYALKPIIDG